MSEAQDEQELKDLRKMIQDLTSENLRLKQEVSMLREMQGEDPLLLNPKVP